MGEEAAMYVLYAEEPGDAQVRWGGCEDPRDKLQVGRIYEVERKDVHSWHTKLFLAGVDSGRGFNSVSFTEVDGATPSTVMGARGA